MSHLINARTRYKDLHLIYKSLHTLMAHRLANNGTYLGLMWSWNCNYTKSYVSQGKEGEGLILNFILAWSLNIFTAGLSSIFKDSAPLFSANKFSFCSSIVFNIYKKTTCQEEPSCSILQKHQSRITQRVMQLNTEGCLNWNYFCLKLATENKNWPMRYMGCLRLRVYVLFLRGGDNLAGTE